MVLMMPIIHIVLSSSLSLNVDYSHLQANGQTLYWKLPAKFLGNKVTAYGGTLKYTFRFSGEGRTNQEPDVIIRVGGYLRYVSVFYDVGFIRVCYTLQARYGRH